jgi:uncharacterized protein (TIGR00255 family)
MTGFARRERQGSWGTLACEIRSVNHRYLELSLRLPEDLRGLEGDVRAVGRARAARSKPVSTCAAGPPTAAIELNRPLIGRAAQARGRD